YHRPVSNLKILPKGGKNFIPGTQARSSRCSGGDAQFGIEREGFSQLVHLAANAAKHLAVFTVIEGLGHPGADLLHFFLFHTSGGVRRSAYADAAGLMRRVV